MRRLFGGERILRSRVSASAVAVGLLLSQPGPGLREWSPMKRNVDLMILPGLDGTEVLFRPFLAALPEWIRPKVVCYPPTGPNSYADLLKLVREKAAGLPGPFYVLASSFGGPLAVMLAAAEPSRVQGLILSATFLRAPTARLPRLRFATVGPLVWIVRAIRRIPLWTWRRRDDPYRQAKAEIWRRVSARCLATRMRAVLAVDVREIFRRGSEPVLCIAFAQDRVVPRHNAEDIARCRPAVETVTIAGDHFAMWKAPVPWTAAIVRFIRERELRRG